LQDRVWDTYLKGLLNHAYAPRPAPPVNEPQPASRQPETARQETVKASPPPLILPPPAWSQTAFQSMFFSVGKMQLAAPLVTLREVVQYNPALIKNLPGQRPWVKGIMDHRGEIINLVDPGSILMGAEYIAPDRPYRYILLTDTPGIGYLCHEFVDMSRLEPEGIRWYQNRVKRPWLAGIHKQRLCTVIDIARLLPHPFNPK